MSNYRDLAVWQKSRRLTAAVYRLTRKFPREEMFGLTQQMRRAAVSVRGSLLELETEAILAADLDYASQEEADKILAEVAATVRPLNGLIRHYTTKPKR